MKGAAMAEREGTMLLGWLRLLGYTVIIERNGSHWIGLATRPGRAGSDVCIDGTAGSRRELVSTLFSGAVRNLELQPA
jgi:hypothetical protein